MAGLGRPTPKRRPKLETAADTTPTAATEAKPAKKPTTKAKAQKDARQGRNRLNPSRRRRRRG